MSNGTLVDTIIRGAAVDLFHSYSIALAPLAHTYRPGELQLPEVAAFIDFQAPSFAGTLYLCCPFDLIPDGGNANRKATAEDWVRELTNQLLGRIKKRLLQSNVDLKAGLPKTGNSELIQRHFVRVKNPKLYEFRTLRGPVVLLIDGTVSDSVVSYSGTAANASEGDIILFESEAPVD
jgi:hypothetical protein